MLWASWIYGENGVFYVWFYVRFKYLTWVHWKFHSCLVNFYTSCSCRNFWMIVREKKTQRNMRTFSQTYGRTKCNVTIRLHIILIRAIHIQTRKNAFDRNRMSNKKNDQIGLCVCVCSGVSYCFFLSIFMSLWYGKTFSFDSIVDFDFLHHPTETRIQFSNSMALGCA